VTEPDRAELADLVRRLAVVHGRVTLSSGKEADYYVDLRRATLFGGLTLGADPVATAIMHAPGRPIDAFAVRKSAKTHGLQRLIEGSEVAGQRVSVVEDTSTTGAAKAIRAEGLLYRSVLGLADLGLG
jgi:orotate phosphoribosyltransferase